jgi:hypothetical protein
MMLPIFDYFSGCTRTSATGLNAFTHSKLALPAELCNARSKRAAFWRRLTLLVTAASREARYRTLRSASGAAADK